MAFMNKYKIVSLFLGIALLTSLVHLVATHRLADTLDTQAPADPRAIVLSNILSRKSVRSYTNHPVSREQVDTLLRAAMAAPSGRDMRPWKFVVVERGPIFDSLSQSLPYAKMLEQAQVAIVVCGDASVVDDNGNPSRTGLSTVPPPPKICC